MAETRVVIDITLSFERETKATYIFRQPADRNTNLVTQAVYVKKVAFPDGRPPRTIRLRLTTKN